MSLDIVEIALDRLTDFADFERLATEVMQNEGYPDIKPLGGYRDSGRDAVVETFYELTRRRRTIFQFTSQETVKSKLESTIKRLAETGQEYSTLVLVTTNRITAERQDELQRVARDADISLEIFDRKTLVARLSNFQNGLFHRHFPNIQQQVLEMSAARPKESFSSEELLRASRAFVMSDEADRARRGIIRELTLALLLHERTNATTVSGLVALSKDVLPQMDPLEPSQVKSALDALTKDDLVKHVDGWYAPTAKAIERSLASASADSRGLIGLASDVADRVSDAARGNLAENERRLIERNAVGALQELFRLYGLDTSSQILGRTATQNGSYDRIVAVAERDLSPAVSRATVAALGDLVSHPNDEQAEILAQTALGFLGAAVMQVDPAVRELQRTRLRGKIFILDTDFLVQCVIRDLPQFAPSIDLVRDLLSIGTRVIVPWECVSEAASHAGRMGNVMSFFGANFEELQPSQVEDKVNNAFAKGWWYFRKRTGSTSGYSTYLANYYEGSAPSQFMAEVVRSTLPKGVEIGDVDRLLGVSPPTERVAAIEVELRTLIKNSHKSTYRDDAEIESLASVDAHLHAAASMYGRAESSGALGKSCYLLTSSLRFIRAQRKLGARDEISVRPNTLAGLLRLVGESKIAARDFVQLFDNPFLQRAVAVSWDDVRGLLELGVRISTVTSPRLAWDIEMGLHDRLSALHELETRASEGRAAESAVSDEYVHTLDFAHAHGYLARPVVNEVLAELNQAKAAAVAERQNADMVRREMQAKLDEQATRYALLEQEIEFFGRRRQRYLKRVAQGDRTPPPRK